MGQSNNKSYHITKEIDGKSVILWPFGILNVYCTSKNEAINEFNKMIKEDQYGMYQLVSYNTVIAEGQVIGITGECTIEDEYGY